MSTDNKSNVTFQADRTHWAQPENHESDWSPRSVMAAQYIPDGVNLLEIGVGGGAFRKAVQGRCDYHGADLAPLEQDILTLNLDEDDLPPGKFDYIVFLGVAEYLKHPELAVEKVCEGAQHVVASFCCRHEHLSPAEVKLRRGKVGWVNHYSLTEFVAMFAKNQFELEAMEEYNRDDTMIQFVMDFCQTGTGEFDSRSYKVHAANINALRGENLIPALKLYSERLSDTGKHLDLAIGGRLAAALRMGDWDLIERLVQNNCHRDAIPPWWFYCLAKSKIRLKKYAEAIFSASRYSELSPQNKPRADQLITEALRQSGAVWPFQSHLIKAEASNLEDHTEEKIAQSQLSDRAHDVRYGLDLSGDWVAAQNNLEKDPEADQLLRENSKSILPFLIEEQKIPATAERKQQKAYCHGLMTYVTNNIGDDIQSLAALGFIPASQDLAFADRDNLLAAKSPTSLPLIMNGWFAHLPTNLDNICWPPSEVIDPSMISLHITPAAAPMLLTKTGLDWLRTHMPIGCRDKYTVNLLQMHGIDSFFSGCLTLTLQRPSDITPQNNAYIVDVPQLCQTDLHQRLRERGIKDVIERTHMFEVGRAYPASRLSMAAGFLRDYAASKFVVTSRLHCALPCLAMGVPVLFMVQNTEDERYEGLVPKAILTSIRDYLDSPDEVLDRAFNFKYTPIPETQKSLEHFQLQKPMDQESWYTRLVNKTAVNDDDSFARIVRFNSCTADPNTDMLDIVKAVKTDNLTYLSEDKFDSLIQSIIRIKDENVDGDFYELGIALGGSAILLASQIDGRKFHGFDVFGMIPPPSDRDEPDSHKRYEKISGGHSKGIGEDVYYGYVTNLYDLVVQKFHEHGLQVDQENIVLHKGLFEETLHPKNDDRIALAHIDCDWYDPVTYCLKTLADNMSPGGLIIIDDFNDFKGCQKATLKFLEEDKRFTLEREKPHAILRRKID